MAPFIIAYASNFGINWFSWMKISGEIGRDTVISLIGHYAGYLASAIGLGNSLHKNRCQYIHLLILDVDRSRRQGCNTHFVFAGGRMHSGDPGLKVQVCLRWRKTVARGLWSGNCGDRVFITLCWDFSPNVCDSAETDLQLQVLSIPISQPP